MCGELILRIAIRCKHCRSDLTGYEADQAQPPHSGPYGSPAATPWGAPPVVPSHTPPHGAEQHPHPRSEYVPPETGDFEQRFLDFAFKTNLPINPATVAFALKIK